jgi:TRAP-type uncharacterized transport system substrate-binding protein
MELCCLKTALFAITFGLAVPAIAEVGQLPPLSEISAYVEPAGGEFVICTGGPKGAYFRTGAQLAGLMEALASQPDSGMNITDASPKPGGGTYGCLEMLALGKADAAIIQTDGQALLKTIGPDLQSVIESAGSVLTEEVLTICSRKNSVEDFGDIAQDGDAVIAIGGSKMSGTNVMLNVISGFDTGYARPTYNYVDSPSGSFTQAVKKVADGNADCATAVMDINSPEVAQISATYGDRVRLVGAWDTDFRTLNYRGKQVYGWRAIPADTFGVKALLDWNGRGKMWSPEVITETAIVVYRTELPEAYSDNLRAAVTLVAKLKTDVQK